MLVEFINLGRENVNKKIKVDNKKQLLREIKKHILSNNFELIQTETNRFVVCVGFFRTVGEVVILEEAKSDEKKHPSQHTLLDLIGV